MGVCPIGENVVFDHVPRGIPLVLHKNGARGPLLRAWLAGLPSVAGSVHNIYGENF